MNRRLVGLIVLVVIVVGIGGYYEVTQYDSGVVSTTIVNGQITGIVVSNANSGAAGVLGNALGQAAGAAAAKSSSSTSGAALITISVGSTSFSQIIACNKTPYSDGQTVQVADEVLRSGGHSYIANIACKGNPLPFQSMNLSSATTITSSSSTTA